MYKEVKGEFLYCRNVIFLWDCSVLRERPFIFNWARSYFWINQRMNLTCIYCLLPHQGRKLDSQTIKVWDRGGRRHTRGCCRSSYIPGEQSLAQRVRVLQVWDILENYMTFCYSVSVVHHSPVPLRQRRNFRIHQIQDVVPHFTVVRTPILNPEVLMHPKPLNRL